MSEFISLTYLNHNFETIQSLVQNHIVITSRRHEHSLSSLAPYKLLVVAPEKTSFTSFLNLSDAIAFSNTIYPDKKRFVIDSSIPSLPCMKRLYLQDEENVNTQHWVNISGTWRKRENRQEQAYLSLLQDILTNGDHRDTRNGTTLSLFSKTLSFDLRDGFPLLTTKRMFFRGIVEELLFFIRGQTDSKLLENKGVNIWRPNTSRSFLDNLEMTTRPEGIMGPLYGYQWRHYNAPYDESTGTPLTPGIDQLQHVVDTIKTDPHSRRILLTTYNPLQASQGVLYPCHSIVNQFYVSRGILHMSCYNRSQDTFLGTPFNIASSALLLTLISALTELTPGVLTMNLGDVHIYEPHIELVKEQVSRTPFPFPKLILSKQVRSLADVERLEASDFLIEDYNYCPAIKAEMVA